ncbi:transposase DNA-binding-containing protein [Bradyrhizobium sp. B117]|uniref:transposase DNA-binding-containing protein n=1 Tax=Bradyrhizobium sp. B117 TaxID=3140246 RepID=UPI00318423C1
MSTAPGQPVPAACGDWAATKAAYSFFDNQRVTEHGMLAGHFAATAMRCAASEGPILILQDTTEFIYSRAQSGKIGFTKTINAGRYKAGQPNVVTLCGVLMHSSLAVTLGGTPLGLTPAKFWTRTKFKGTWTLKRHVNPTRVRSRRRKAIAGWRTCASRWRSWARRNAACMWPTATATSTSSFAWRRISARAFSCECRPTDWPARPPTQSHGMELIGSSPSSRPRLGRDAITSRSDRMRRRACT